MFEPPVAGNSKPSGDGKMELRLLSGYRLPLNQSRKADRECKAVCVCVRLQAAGVTLGQCEREGTSADEFECSLFPHKK